MSSTDTLTDAWLRLWSPTINLPGSGSIGKFNYHPYTTWAFSGNETIEQEVYRDVASPGRQLGKLTEVVLELIAALENQNPKVVVDTRNVEKLKAMTERIELIKTRVGDNTASAAKELLDKLKATDEKKFEALMKEYAPSTK